MKHSYLTKAAVAGPLLLLIGGAACTDDFTNSGREGSVFVTPTTAYLRMRSADLDFTYDGLASGPRTIRVESYGMPWTLTPSADWIKVSPASGTGTQDVTVTVEEHTNADATRHGTILLNYDPEAGQNLVVPGLSYRWEVPLVQQRPNAVISASMPEVTPGIAEMIPAKAGATVEIPVTANCEWSINSFPSWLSVVKLGDRIAVSVTDQNNSPESRRGTIRLNYNLKRGTTNIKTYDIPITQDILHISTPAVKLRFERQGGVKTVEGISLEGNTVISAPTWLHLNTDTQPDGRTTIEVHADENTTAAWGTQLDTRRSGYIAISAKSASGTVERARIEVEQDPRVFSISGADGKTTDAVNGLVAYWRVPVTGDDRTVQVTTNSDFSVEAGNSWLNVGGTTVREFQAPATGTKTYDIDLGTDYNDASGVRRRGWFYFKYPAVSDLLMVNQDGPVVSTDVSGNTWAFNNHSCDFSFNVEATAKWTVEFVNPDGTTPYWLRATAGSPGTGNVPGGEQLTIHVDANYTDASRTCYMRLNVAGFKGLKYLITQYGSTIVSNGSILDFAADGQGQHQIFLRTESDPTVECDADWIHVDGGLTGTTGINELKSYAYTISVDPNPNYAPRNSTLKIKYTDNGTAYESQFTITQMSYPVVLKFEGTTNYGNEGGTMIVFATSQSSAEIEVSSTEDWISIGEDEGDGRHTVTIHTLAETIKRTGKIIARYKGDTTGFSEKTIQITQWGPIKVNPESYTFSQDGGSVQLSVLFPPGMSLVSFSQAQWITKSLNFSPNGGTGSLNVTVPASEVERLAYVEIISSDGRCRTEVPIRQVLEEITYHISLPHEIIVNNSATSIPFTVTTEGSPVSYEINCDWLRVQPSNVGQYTLVIDELPSDVLNRTGQITFSSPDCNYQYIVTVIQQAKVDEAEYAFETSLGTLNTFSPSVTSYQFSVSTNIPYSLIEASTTVDWMNVALTSDFMGMLGFSTNTTGASRMGYVKFTTPIGVYNYLVIQQPR